jgi:pyruvate kinase
MRKAKIVATFGPSIDDPLIAESVIRAGVNVVRMNFSHGTHEEHKRRADEVREIAEKTGQAVAILADLQGPKIRTGKLKEGPVMLVKGQRFAITSDEILGDADRVSTTYKPLIKECVSGERIFLDDGKIRLQVVEKTETDIVTRVLVGGRLKDNKAINLPGTKISAPCLTEKDIDDLTFAINKMDVEYVALSFVRTADDIRMLKTLIKDMDGDVGIIAKIEKPEALKNIEEILDTLVIGDGIMIARGDLGVEVDIWKVPKIQKELVAKANSKGLITIVATQMLESMMEEPMPSRAEATDIFNAVLDGTDAAMLSGETAAGKNPLSAVMAMDKLITEAEDYVINYHLSRACPTMTEKSFGLATVKASVVAAESIEAKGIVALTRSGKTGFLLAKMACPPSVPIFALTAEIRSYRKMAILHGVRPALMKERFDPITGVWDIVDQALLATDELHNGDTIVIASGHRIGPGHTNVCKIVKLGERDFY